MIDINTLPSEETLSSNGSEPSKEIENEDGVFSPYREEPELGNTSTIDGEAEIPSVGMAFNSFGEARDFYQDYASKKGFRITTRSKQYEEDGNIKYSTLVCSRAGKTTCTKKSHSMLNSAIKTDCKARINIRAGRDGKVYISDFIPQHNHEVSPERRFVSDDEMGTQMNYNFQLLASNKNASSGPSRNLRLGDGDADSIFSYFTCKQKQDPNFFCVSNMNKDCSPRNVFWADGRSRALYDSFRDVISFESTYQNNKYKVPLVSFLGVNHHGQSILLGSGLLFLDDKESYTWLFRSWLKCMCGRPPKAIITDQHASIQEAVSEVFPNVRHRPCLKHIIEKISSKLCELPDYVTIKKALKSTVFESFTIREFEENWERFIEEFKLENNNWLKTLYLDRAQWVPAYVKRTFWAGLSGNVKPFFDGYIQPETTLRQFMERYNTFLRSKIEKEEQADFTSSSFIIPTITYFPLEKQFQEAYTNEMFTLFQEELKGLIYCNTLVKTKGPIFTFQVKDTVKKKDGLIQKVVYEVRFNSILGEVWCECGLLEFCGILCRHSVAALFDQDVKEVPSRYILSRWRKDIKRKHKGVNNCSKAMKTCEKMARFDDLRTICHRAAKIGAESEEHSNFAMKLLDETKAMVLKRKEPSSSLVKEGDGVRNSLAGRYKGVPPMKKQKGCETCERTLLRSGWRLERSSQIVHMVTGNPSERSNSYVQNPKVPTTNL